MSVRGVNTLKMEYYNFTCIGHVPALKNERGGFAFRAKKGKTSWTEKEVRALVNAAQVSRPSSEVQQYITSLRGKMQKMMTKKGWGLIQKPTYIVCVICFGVYYDTYPKADLDNKWTTVQEALQGVVIENDVQVRAATYYGVQVPSKDMEHIDLLVIPVTEEPTLKVIISNLQVAHKVLDSNE